MELDSCNRPSLSFNLPLYSPLRAFHYFITVTPGTALILTYSNIDKMDSIPKQDNRHTPDTVNMLNNFLSSFSIKDSICIDGTCKSTMIGKFSNDAFDHPLKTSMHLQKYLTLHARSSFMNNLDGIPTGQARIFNGRII